MELSECGAPPEDKLLKHVPFLSQCLLNKEESFPPAITVASWVQEELTRMHRERTRATVSSLEIKLNGRETKMLTNYGNTEYREEVW